MDLCGYSNTHPTDDRYQSINEPYLVPYAMQFGHPIDAPFHYKNARIEDFLAVGNHGRSHC